MKKIGRIKFWSSMGFALVYYLISYPLFVLRYFTPSGETDTKVMNNILVVSMSSIVTGIIFGAAFLSIARTLRRGTAIRDYLILAAYGMLIFYIAGSATVSQAAYPPFGLVSTAHWALHLFDICRPIFLSCYIIPRSDFTKNYKKIRNGAVQVIR